MGLCHPLVGGMHSSSDLSGWHSLSHLSSSLLPDVLSAPHLNHLLEHLRGSPSARCICVTFFPTGYTWQSLYLRVPWSGVPLLAV